MTDFYDQDRPPEDPPPVQLPPSRRATGVASRATEADAPARPSDGDWVDLPPRRRRGGGGAGGTGGSGRLLLAVVAVVVVLVAVVAVVGRDKLKSVFGDDKHTTSSEAAPVRVSIPEGFRLAQILYRFGQAVPRFHRDQLKTVIASGRVTSKLLPAGGVAADDLPPNGSPLEGLLFPATYTVAPGQTPAVLLNGMAAQMEEVAHGLGIDEAAQRLRITPYQVVIVASMVQREAGNSAEAPKIARVIYNRLAQGMPLQIDATLQYLHCARVTQGDCTTLSPGQVQAMKSDPSGYNTYGHVGLPPTPIGAPGQYALQAAITPASGSWLFYVRDTHNDAHGEPQHLFFDSDTGPDYAAAVQACQQANLGC